jgi:hypothetical protein
MEAFSFVAPLAWSLEYLMLWTDKTKIVHLRHRLGGRGDRGVAGLCPGSRQIPLGGLPQRRGHGMHMLGGMLMGFGGITALGCTIGQGISGFPPSRWLDCQLPRDHRGSAPP